MTLTLTDITDQVPERHYTHHPDRGETPHRTNPIYVHRELETARVEPGMNVLEVGTGSGYSGALLSALVGTDGTVTSVDIDPYLTQWANHIHARRGLGNIRCHAADGTVGFPARAPYDRLLGWCSPPLLPTAWVEQVAERGRIVATLPIGPVPNLAIGAVITVTAGQPHVERLFPGAYIETGAAPRHNFDVPARWADWERRVPAPAWVSIAWRAEDDWRHNGARTVLDRLLQPGHTEPYAGPDIAWGSWRTWAAATGDSRLTMTELTLDTLGLGHSTPTSAAVLQTDGTILADAPDSPSLTTLRTWITAWEKAGRPAPDTYTPTLVPADHGQGVTGWDLRLSPPGA
ncbi:methyltransferase domain-containing protein [Streptomyces sp. NPDC003077]|uniref:protein-L-isoaspartate O-methyltransferase family protein n=1 Tax=Streptomyces sp. NPDC003077 TaxID=3154443 RepID=UPI0033A179CE